ncbi:hypothetical protein QE435_005059 [Rhizobium sp. SORGH_AS 787]|nr:hypothetical protein [Rhizobium sp. SORGH_AS_0787]
MVSSCSTPSPCLAFRSRRHDFKWAVVIAMITMLVVQAAIDKIINVIAMRDCLMSAPRSVDVVSCMPRVTFERMAALRIGWCHFNNMFVDMVPMRMMKMSVVKVVHVISMLDSDMAAASTVLMVVMVMVGQVAIAHGNILFTLMMFAGMVDSVVDQCQDMVVGYGVKGALAVLSSLDQTSSE